MNWTVVTVTWLICVTIIVLYAIGKYKQNGATQAEYEHRAVITQIVLIGMIQATTKLQFKKMFETEDIYDTPIIKCAKICFRLLYMFQMSTRNEVEVSRYER